MDTSRLVRILPQFLNLFPAAASCYFAMKNQMKYTPLKTAALCLAALLPYSLLSSLLCAALYLDANTILLPSLVPFFLLYRHTVNTDTARCLAVYVGICAMHTFPAQFAFAFDAFLHPASGAADFSTEAAFFQFGLSCLTAAVCAYPACRWLSQAVDRLDIPKTWYSITAVSAIFLVLNVLAVPKFYSTIHTGRIFFIFPLLESFALMLLIVFYILFYQNSMVILEHAALKERAQLLELQSRQYRALQEHMRQTARLRHDFRHSVRLLSSLVEKGDIGSVRAHLAAYEISLAKNAPVNYCTNAALNALFGYYHEMADAAGIETDWHIELPETLADAELDMASLFGNLMENAIHGCLTVPEKKRYFCLTAETRHAGWLYVVSTNSFDGEVRKGKDGWLSTKHGGKGTGLASIAAVAEKYGGSAKFSNSGTQFFMDVVLKTEP